MVFDIEGTQKHPNVLPCPRPWSSKLGIIGGFQKGTVRRQCCSSQGWLKIWIWQLWPKFVTFIPLWILVNGTNIICLPTKNKQFCKIKRLWLKNWACHAHLKFKIQKGVASLFFEPHPPNFGKICILYRWKNDIITFFK